MHDDDDDKVDAFVSVFSERIDCHHLKSIWTYERSILGSACAEEVFEKSFQHANGYLELVESMTPGCEDAGLKDVFCNTSIQSEYLTRLFSSKGCKVSDSLCVLEETRGDVGSALSLLMIKYPSLQSDHTRIKAEGSGSDAGGDLVAIVLALADVSDTRSNRKSARSALEKNNHDPTAAAQLLLMARQSQSQSQLHIQSQSQSERDSARPVIKSTRSAQANEFDSEYILRCIA